MTDSELDHFDPESILPGQMSRRGRDWSPEERLALAVLEISWEDLQGRGPQGTGGRLMAARRAKLKNEARLWFRSPLDGVFSYIWVCHALGLEPRRAFFGLREHASRVPAPKPGLHPNSLRARLQRASLHGEEEINQEHADDHGGDNDDPEPPNYA